jgi:cytidine deaminase
VGVSSALVDRARAAMRNAHAPYSEFHVGAAIEAADGTIHVGCNVESASYGLTICAERMALGAAVAAGAYALRRVVVNNELDTPAAPCGACRQLLAEFGLDLEVIAVGPQSERRWTLRQLLPDAFTRETLDR